MEQHAQDTIKRWTAKRRTALVLRVLKGEMSIAEAARQQRLSVVDVENWYDQYLHTTENGLRGRPKDEEALKDEPIKKLKQKIGEIVVMACSDREIIGYEFALRERAPRSRTGDRSRLSHLLRDAPAH